MENLLAANVTDEEKKRREEIRIRQKKHWVIRLKQAAKDIGYSQTRIAKLMMIRQPSVNAWFRGLAVPNMERLRELADVLEVSPYWLWDGDMTKVPQLKDSDETEKLLQERALTHGPATETFKMGINLLNVVKDVTYQSHHFAIINILHKIARILCGSYNPDHWDDIEGYARLGKKIQEEDSVRSN